MPRVLEGSSPSLFDHHYVHTLFFFSEPRSNTCTRLKAASAKSDQSGDFDDSDSNSNSETTNGRIGPCIPDTDAAVGYVRAAVPPRPTVAAATYPPGLQLRINIWSRARTWGESTIGMPDSPFGGGVSDRRPDNRAFVASLCRFLGLDPLARAGALPLLLSHLDPSLSCTTSPLHSSLSVTVTCPLCCGARAYATTV